MTLNQWGNKRQTDTFTFEYQTAENTGKLRTHGNQIDDTIVEDGLDRLWRKITCMCNTPPRAPKKDHPPAAKAKKGNEGVAKNIKRAT